MTSRPYPLSPFFSSPSFFNGQPHARSSWLFFELETKGNRQVLIEGPMRFPLLLLGTDAFWHEAKTEHPKCRHALLFSFFPLPPRSQPPLCRSDEPEDNAPPSSFISKQPTWRIFSWRTLINRPPPSFLPFLTNAPPPAERSGERD